MSKEEKLIQKFQKYPLPKEIDFDDFVTYAKIFGFEIDRVRGSHNMLVNKDKTVMFPVPTVNGKKVKSIYLREFNKIICKKED